jgi:excisionase family DNA binding protein
MTRPTFPAQDNTIWTVTEITTLLRVSNTTVHRWINSGQLRAMKFGRITRVPDSNLRQLLHAPPAGSLTDWLAGRHAPGQPPRPELQPIREADPGPRD